MNLFKKTPKTPCSNCGRTKTRIVYDKESDEKFVLCESCLVSTKLLPKDLRIGQVMNKAMNPTTPAQSRRARAKVRSNIAMARHRQTPVSVLGNRGAGKTMSAQAVVNAMHKSYGQPLSEKTLKGHGIDIDEEDYVVESKPESEMEWKEPDGSKTILKFDSEGNLIGRK